MTLKALAHLAHQSLEARAGCPLRRSHLYELLAAMLGYQSWAAFDSDALLADAGVGVLPDGALARIFGRACQLDYAQPAAESMAHALVELAVQQQLGVIRWNAFEPLLRLPPNYAAPSSAWGTGLMQRQFQSSPLLLDSLERAAVHDARAHHAIAAICRCAKPNPYLYEESLKGRVLNIVEQQWVDNYLRTEPLYRNYEKHLKMAAEGGVRAAALEYGNVFERPDFITLADQLEGEVDPMQMADAVTTQQARHRWLRKAAEAGSWPALKELADQGDPWAEELVAPRANTNWLRSAAELALEFGDTLRAWVWQYVALARGADLTLSTPSSATAHHAEGEHRGEFYDSDFGGPLYVEEYAGEEGMDFPELSPAEHETAKAWAHHILRPR